MTAHDDTTTGGTTVPLDWTGLLSDQLDWYWGNLGRSRIEGLTDEEYLWEPVPDCWSVRPRGTSTAPVQGGSGAMVIEFAFPEPVPAPFTTIAWRLGHIIVGVLAMRNASHFGGEQVDYTTFEYAETAQGALAQLDAEYARWRAGVASMSEADLARKCGPAEGEFAEYSMAALVLHINREVFHHLAEVCLLRDLYVHAQPAGKGTGSGGGIRTGAGAGDAPAEGAGR